MQLDQEKRKQQRIRYSWPLWFGYSDNGELKRGQVVDLSRSGVSFSVPAELCPAVGAHIKTRFSYPLNHIEHFAIASYYHWSEVIRIDTIMSGVCRVAMRLHQPLEVDPALSLPDMAMESLADEPIMQTV